MKNTAVQEQRAAVRFDSTMPLEIGGRPGETHNVSAQGIYFETDVQQSLGALVSFTLEFQLEGRRHRLLCEGKVVRVDRQGARIGVAARLVAPLFGPTEKVAL